MKAFILALSILSVSSFAQASRVLLQTITNPASASFVGVYTLPEKSSGYFNLAANYLIVTNPTGQMKRYSVPFADLKFIAANLRSTTVDAVLQMVCQAPSKGASSFMLTNSTCRFYSLSLYGQSSPPVVVSPTVVQPPTVVVALTPAPTPAPAPVSNVVTITNTTPIDTVKYKYGATQTGPVSIRFSGSKADIEVFTGHGWQYLVPQADGYLINNSGFANGKTATVSLRCASGYIALGSWAGWWVSGDCRVSSFSFTP